MVKLAKHTVILSLFCVFSAVQAQKLNLSAKENFLDIVAPIITSGELEIYKKLLDYRSQKYFQSIFWYKRSPTPETSDNPFRRSFFERRQVAKIQFGEGDQSGLQTDRGLVFLLLGDPDKVTQNKLPNSGLKPGYEEIWTYAKHDLKLRFVYDGFRPGYHLQGKEALTPVFERIRNSQVLDRAEPYNTKAIPLALPNLGFTKDIENLVAKDQKQLEYELTYSYFRGDLNKTELFVGLTFRDASQKGMVIHLAAYDPYGNKVEDFKKKIEPVNGKFESFSVVIEPDQYDLVLRLLDRDGRESIDRQRFDLPRIGVDEVSASGLLAAPLLETIPLQGFQEPKKFVFGDRYFPIRNLFEGFTGNRLFLMQHFYRFPSLPDRRYFVDDREVEARLEEVVQEGDTFRTVVSIPVEAIRTGAHHIRSVFRGQAGNLVATPLSWRLGKGDSPQFLVDRAKTSEKFRLVHPSNDRIENLSRVVVRPDDDLNVSHMYVFLNDRLVLEADKKPWEVYVDPGLFSISGQNSLIVVLETDQGYLKLEKTLQPLKADEKIKTRVVQIFFNGFNSKLEFLNNLDLSALTVEVDGEPVKPREVRKVEEPITYCFLIDTSYSMKESFEGNISAVRKMIQAMRPIDRGYFVTFDSNFFQFLEPNQSKDVLLATAESLQLQKPNPKQSDSLYVENETYLYDATIAAIHSLHQYSGRKVILLVSDGIGVEGTFLRSAMLSYARENDVVIYSLWLDNNPELSDDELKVLQIEQSRAEKVFRAIGLTRFFARKDAKKNRIGQKIRKSAINQGAVKILAEESGGFHYRIFKADRSLIREYVEDIESAIQNQYVMTLSLPVSMKEQEVDIYSEDPDVSIRSKSHVKVRKTNPLID